LDRDGYAVWPGELARNIHVKFTLPMISHKTYT